MSRKVRERAELKWWGTYLAGFEIKFDIDTASRFIDGIIDHLQPEILRTAEEQMSAAREKMMEAINILEEGTVLTVADAIKVGGLDLKNRSDLARTRMFLKECGQLEYSSGQPEYWSKRITGPEKAPEQTSFDAE